MIEIVEIFLIWIEVLIIRDDFILLEQQFWDQDDQLLKTMQARQIKQLGGRMVASIVRMGKTESLEEWTQMSVQAIEFDLSTPDSVFTLSNLRNPRRWN